jgi:FtsP/CotA-like multicopper oxidase with cupredoxin domain
VHDHTLGMHARECLRRTGGFYLLRGGDDAIARQLPDHEVPILIQDRSFNGDGSLFFPGDRAFFEGVSKATCRFPFIPQQTCDGTRATCPPIWNPEFFGNTMMVNGNTWPFLDVEQRRYRFRLLNALQRAHAAAEAR